MEGNPSYKRSIVAGLVASVVMSVYGAVVHSLGIQGADFAALTGGVFNHMNPVETFTELWWIGLLLHLMLGTFIIPWAYDRLFYHGLLGSDKLRGLEFGVIIFILAEIFYYPLFKGVGFLSIKSPTPSLSIPLALVMDLLYGFTLAALTGHQAPAQKQKPGKHAHA